MFGRAPSSREPASGRSGFAPRDAAAECRLKAVDGDSPPRPLERAGHYGRLTERRRVIENRTSGERIFIRQSAGETGGALLSFELVLAPGGRVPSGHVHPEQQERFTVLDGRMKFRVGIRTTIAYPGETVTVEPGKPHHFANAGSGPARLLVEVRPALGMEELLETASALAGHETWRACIRRGIDLALFLREFEREITVPFLPRALVRALSHPVAWFATSTGLDERYRRRRAGQETTN